MGLILPFSIFSSGSSLNRIVPNNNVKRVLLDSSDNAYISGDFTTLNGMPRNYIAKIMGVNDSVDGNFVYNSLSVIPRDIAINSGNLLVTTSNSLIGLNSFTGTPTSTSYATTDGTIYTIFSDSNGDIFISGNFTSVSSVLKTNFAKLSSLGSLLNTFTSNITPSDAYVVDMDNISPSLNLFVGGTFTTIGSVPKPYFAKINKNTGSVVSDLDCNLDGIVWSVHICSDGNIFIGGNFTNIQTTSTLNCFGKVDLDGALVSGFTQSAVPWGFVYKIVEYKSGIHMGKILVSGTEASTIKLYRLNIDGTVDTSFGTNGSISGGPAIGFANINDIAIRSDGGAVVVGGFTTFGGKERPYYARIDSNGQVL